MKKTSLSTLIILLLLVSTNAIADIYFNQKIAGPITNISRVNHENTLSAVTPGNRQQDKEFSIAPNGDVAFSSNRKDSAKPKTGIDRTRQLAVFIQSEKVIKKISDDNVRSFSPKYNYSGTHVAYLSLLEKNITTLNIYDTVKKTSSKLITSENIFDFDWSSDNKTIVYSESKANTSAIKTINVDSKNIETIASSKIKEESRKKNSIDEKPKEKPKKNSDNTSSLAYVVGAKWSPNKEYIAYIKHPLDREKSKTLHIINVKTREEKQISDAKKQVQAPIDWNSKGDTLVYSALVNYKFYYDEKKMDKVYEGALHVYTSNLEGKTVQLTSGDHYHGKPVFSPNDAHIAFLYAEKLGDERTYALKTMKSTGGQSNTKEAKVSRDSELLWISPSQ